MIAVGGRDVSREWMGSDVGAMFEGASTHIRYDGMSFVHLCKPHNGGPELGARTYT